MSNEPTAFGGIMGMFKEILTSGPVEGLTKFADWGATIGSFFGWVDPKTKNLLDFARDMQDYADNKITRKELVDDGVQGVANWLITSKLEEKGWSPEMAFIAGYIGKKIVGGLARGLGVDSAISGMVGMVTGVSDADQVHAQTGGKQRSGERTATA